MATTKKTATDDKEVSAPSLGTYLKQLSKLAGASQDVNLERHKKGTKLTVVGQGTVASCLAPIKLADEDFRFVVQSAAIDAALSGSLTANPITSLSYNDGSLFIKRSRSSFEIISKEATAIPAVESVKEGYVNIEMNADFWNMLTTALPYLKLEKVSSTQPDARLFVDATEKAVFIGTYDSFQMAFVSRKNTTGVTGSFNVPYSRLLTILKDLPNAGKTSLYFGEDVLIVKSDGFAASYATSPLAENDPKGADVKSKAKEISGIEAATLTFSSADLEEIINSMKAVAQDDTKVTFTANNTTALLESTSSFGSAKAKLQLQSKPKEAVKFALELKFLRNLISKSKEDLNFCIVDNTLVLRTPSVTYVTVTSDL